MEALTCCSVAAEAISLVPDAADLMRRSEGSLTHDVAFDSEGVVRRSKAAWECSVLDWSRNKGC